MRLQTYAALSLLTTATAAAAAIHHSFRISSQFFPAAVHLSTSNVFFLLLLLLFNNAAVSIHASARLVQRIFLGELREAEIESLNERSWRYLAEILCAITVFLPDFTFSFFGMEAALFNLKGLHWLAQKRFTYLKATPLEALNSQLRFCSFLLFLLAVDSLFLYIHLLRSSASLYFVFEYVILVTNAVVILIKYVFFVADMLMEGQFERKAMYTFQLELVRDLLHLLMKSCIIFMLFPNYRIPLLSLYKTFCKFKIRVADYLRYRKITSNLNEHFLNVTTEELQTSDATCIICREEMTTAKKLHCGHLFHVHCLRSWLERKASCPTCRSLIVPTESQTARNRGPQEGQFHPCQTGAGSSNGASTQGPQAGETGVNLNRHQTVLQAAALVHGKLSVTHAGSEAFTNVSHMNMGDVDTVERRRLSDARVTLSEYQEGLLKLSGACLNLRHQIEVEGRRFSGARASLLEAQESLLRLSEASLNLRKHIEVFKQALEFLEKLEVLKAIVCDIDS